MIYLITILAIAIGFGVAWVVHPRPKRKRKRKRSGAFTYVPFGNMRKAIKRKPSESDTIFAQVMEANDHAGYVPDIAFGRKFNAELDASLKRAPLVMSEGGITAEEAAEAFCTLWSGGSDE